VCVFFLFLANIGGILAEVTKESCTNMLHIELGKGEERKRKVQGFNAQFKN